MRKSGLLIVVVLLSFPFGGIAQMEKGSWMLRGNIGLSYEQNRYDLSNITSQGDNYTQYKPAITLSPGLGYFVSDHLAVGIDGTYGRSWWWTFSDNTPVTESRSFSNTFGLGVFVRKFIPLNDKFSIYAEVNGGMGWIRPILKNDDGEKYLIDPTRSVYINGVVGFQYFVTKNISLDIYSNLLQYSSESRIDHINDLQLSKNRDLSINLASSLGVGLSLFLQ